jgi:uncharacterized membrane protein
MVRRGRTTGLQERAESARELAVALAQDKRFRKELVSALAHGRIARRRARRLALIAAVGRFASDQRLVHEVRRMAENLQRALTRAEQRRSQRLRNSLLVAGAGAVVAAAVPGSRRWLSRLAFGRANHPRTITESIEVGVPVATAYDQWTQFEDFPLFMEGLDHVQQLDDTRLHWVATIAGKQAEWDAKILEQHPDRQITWVSEDGKQTRGTVTFEPRGDSRTLIRLSITYQPEGAMEAVGSAAGLDPRRVRGDLERFKELIESRAIESGGWRGEVSARTSEQ